MGFIQQKVSSKRVAWSLLFLGLYLWSSVENEEEEVRAQETHSRSLLLFKGTEQEYNWRFTYHLVKIFKSYKSN